MDLPYAPLELDFNHIALIIHVILGYVMLDMT